MKAHLFLALRLLLAAPANAQGHDLAIESIDFAGKAAGTQVMTRPASHPRNTKFNVMLTPESTNTWYLGASPGGAGITESGSKLRSVLGAGYSARIGSSLRYELRVSRESSTTTRVQLAVKF